MDALSRWRSRTKVVAILDLIFSSLSLLALIVAGIMLYYLTVDRSSDISIHDLHVTFMWIMVVINVVINAVQLWVSVKLLNSTKKERNGNEAAKMAETWKIVSIMILILNIASLFYEPSSFIKIGIRVIVRGIFLYVVSKFICELEMANTTNQGLDEVTTAQGHEPDGEFKV